MKLEWDLWIQEPYCISGHGLILVVYCRYVGECPFSKIQTQDLGARGLMSASYSQMVQNNTTERIYRQIHTEVRQMW